MSKIETSPRRLQDDGKHLDLLEDRRYRMDEDNEDLKKDRSYELSATKSKIIGGGSRGKPVVITQRIYDPEAERKQKEKCRKITIIGAFALIAVISGILLAVILSAGSGGSSSGQDSGSFINETTKAPSPPCRTRLDPFSSSIPSSFLIRFVMGDFCLNYPSLDCFGAPDLSESSLLGATLLDGSWQFRDDVGLRVVKQDGRVFIRLEVRHAHDSLGEDRAFVYTVVARQTDLCFESFHFYELSRYQTGRFRCSSSIPAARNHSEVVALFLQRPTHFVERRDNAWVIDTPASRSGARSFSVPDRDFLIGVQPEGETARFLVDPPRAFSLIGLLDADARSPMLENTCIDDSGWARQTMAPLAPRMNAPEADLDLEGGDEETGTCSAKCTNTTTSAPSLNDISNCIQTCIEQFLTGAEQGFRLRRLAATNDNTDTGAADDGDNEGGFFTLVFQPSAGISQTLMADKTRQRDEDDRLRQCIAPIGNETDRTALEDSAQLLDLLKTLETELGRVQLQMDELDQALVESITFISGIAADAFEAMRLMTQYRARVYPYLYTIRMYSSRSSTIAAASEIIAELESTFEPGFQDWSRFLNAMAWNGSTDDLAALQDLQARLLDARTHSLALGMYISQYLIPLVRGRSGSEGVNLAAEAIAAEVNTLVQLYSSYEVNAYGLPNLHYIVTDSKLESLMGEFMEAATDGVAFFRQALQKLEVAMNSQVSIMLTATKNKREVPINDGCDYDFGPDCIAQGETCRMISSGLVQSFDTPVTDLALSRCSNPSTDRPGCTVAESSTCNAIVQVPIVSRQLRTWIIKVALQIPGTKNDLVEDTVENALRFWSDVVAFPEGVPFLTSVDHSGALLKVLSNYQDPPSTDFATCIPARFRNNPLNCVPLRPLMDALEEYCDLDPGESCLLDSNCRSGACRGDVCCAGAYVNCPTQCVTGTGVCLTGAPSRTPSLSPTLRPTKTTLSPTQVTFLPTRSPTTSLPTTTPTTRPSTSPSSKSATPHPTVRPTTKSPTRRVQTSSPTRSKRPSASPTTSRPSRSPTERGAVPTKLPTTRRPTPDTTSVPSTTPTRRPSAPPTNSPIITRSPTQQPTDSPTLRPTLAPIVTLCERPRTSCESLRSEAECDLWSGCGWNTEVDVCYTQDCSEFSCRVRQQAFQTASIILPGCRLGDDITCDKQRLQAFNGLKLGAECSATFLPVRNGGWLGREQILPVFPAASSDVFISAGTGSDTSGTGSRNLPFKTLERALVETRKTTPNSRRKIILLPGEPYRVRNTVRLGPLDSGLIIQGETQPRTGLRPRITSSIPLQGARWELFRDSIIRTKLTAEMVASLDDLSALYIDNQPATRARFPNLDDPLSFRYNPGGIVSDWGRPRAASALIRRENRVIVPGDDPAVRYHRASIPYNRFSAGYGGACSHFDPPVSYFCDPAHFAQGGCPYSLPSSVSFSRSPFGGRFWSKPQTAYFHSLHWYGWGLWTFRVRSQTPYQVIFDRGGWQEARGDCGIGGSGWYVENVIELLDYPNEFFIDLDDGYLYYYPNTPQRNPMLNPNAKIEITTAVRRFIEVMGESRTRPVSDVTIRNIEFFGGHATHMDPFTAPSGGDWTIHRGGAVHLEHVEDSRVQGNFFLWCSGNAVFLSRHIRNVDVQYNDFWAVGGTAIAVVGDPNFESAEPWKITDYADTVRIFGNVAAELGLIVKQSAGSFVTLGKRVQIEQNVFYDGPRGGIVFNDGFGGGHIVRKNVVFQFVLETNDHGPFDTWDRQQYDEPARPVNTVDWNIFLGTAAGPKGIDFDDGTYNWISENNVVVWGYQKFKGSNIQARNNLILYPLASSCAFFTPQNRVPANWVWENNTCVSYRPPYGYNAGRAEVTTLCDASNFKARLNTYYYLGSEGQFDSCTVSPLSWGEWRSRYNQDAGSIFLRRSPLVSEMDDWVRAKLSWVNEIMRGSN